LREQGSGTRRTAEEGLAAAGVRPRVAMELGSNAAVAGAVAAGAGVGVVPLRTAGALKEVRRVEVRGLALSRPFVLLTERGRRLSPAAEAFVANCVRKEHP
jgi:DNA-binding transcriptional LysR family regulator